MTMAVNTMASGRVGIQAAAMKVPPKVPLTNPGAKP